MFIVVLWAWSYKAKAYISNQALINLLSMSIYYLFLNKLYVNFVQMKERQENMLREYGFIPITIFVASLVLKQNYVYITVSMFIYIILLFVFGLKKFYWMDFLCWILLILAIILYSFDFRFETLIFVIVAVFLNTKKHYGYKHIRQINILSISKSNSIKLIPVVVVFLTFIAYLLELDTILINVFMHVVMVIFMLLLLINVESMEVSQKKMESFYTLTVYLERERNEFSSLLHDEIIQDIKASKTLLGLNEPDIKYSMKILTDLENKIRQIMNFYSSNLFNYFSFRENFENMILSIKNLYPMKQLELNRIMPENIKNKEFQKVIMQISKELINNVYKHSEGTYINFEVKQSNGNITIFCESDGANQKDYENIDKSMGGILILKLLINRNKGEMHYSYQDGILKTEINLEKESLINENPFI